MDILANRISRIRLELYGFSALWIYFFHMWICLLSDIPVIGFVEYAVKRMGFVGVDIFLLLSGMGLIRSFDKHGLKVYYMRRFKRITPPFLIVGVLRMLFEKWTLKEILVRMTGIDLLLTDIQVFLWFVPMIAVMYIVFPLYYSLFKKAKMIVFFSSLGLWLAFDLYFTNLIPLVASGFIARIPIFLIGIYIGERVNHGIDSRNFRLSNINYLDELPLLQAGRICFSKSNQNCPKIELYFGGSIIILGIGIILGFYTLQYDIVIITKEIDLAITNICLAFSLSIILSRIFELHKGSLSKILVFYGTISLEFYCLQEWLGNIVIALLKDVYFDGIINVVTFISVTISAVCLYKIQQIQLFTMRTGMGR